MYQYIIKCNIPHTRGIQKLGFTTVLGLQKWQLLLNYLIITVIKENLSFDDGQGYDLNTQLVSGSLKSMIFSKYFYTAMQGYPTEIDILPNVQTVSIKSAWLLTSIILTVAFRISTFASSKQSIYSQFRYHTVRQCPMYRTQYSSVMLKQLRKSSLSR